MITRFLWLILLLWANVSPAGAQSTSPVFSQWLDAARNGDTTLLSKLWLDQPTLLGEKDSRGSDALILATYYGHLPAVTWLLDKGADTKSTDLSGNTALMGALFRQHEAIARYLVTHGADINQRNFQEATAMHFAVIFSPDSLVLWLLEKGGDANLADRFGTSVFQQAEIQGRSYLFNNSVPNKP